MRQFITLLLSCLSIVAAAQPINNPRVKIKPCTTCAVAYEAKTDTPKGYYPNTDAGYATWLNDVKNGGWTLTLDNGAVIPKGTKPPKVAPTPSQIAGPSWANMQYSMNNEQIIVEGSGSELNAVRFQRVDGTPITGINPDGVTLDDQRFFGYGSNNDVTYPKKWVGTFSPSIIGKQFRITSQRTNGDLFVKEFVPVAGANKVQLYVASGSGNNSPPTSTTTAPTTTQYTQTVESESATKSNSGQDVYTFDDPNSSGAKITCCFTRTDTYLNYTFTGVPGPGTLTLSLTYQTNTSSTAQGSITVNGSTLTVDMAGLGGGKATVTTSVPVIAGSNTIRIAGKTGTFLQDKVMLSGSITTTGSGGTTTPPTSGNVTTTYPVYTIGGMLGNSITTYRASTVPGEWPYANAMAVDAPQYDNAHIVEAGLKTVSPSFRLYLMGQGSGLELSYNSSDAEAVDNNIRNIKSDLAQDFPGGVQFNPFIYNFGGENTGGTYDETKLRAMFDKVFTNIPRPSGGKVIMRTSFYKGKDQTDAFVRKYCAEKGYDVVDISDVQERTDLSATEYAATNAGWAKHPNRAGHALIGGRILDKLKVTTTTTTPPVTTTPTTTVGAGQGLYALNSTYVALSESGGRPAYAQPSWITNGTLKIGITPTAGDVITHLQMGDSQSVANNPIFSNQKLDLGRQFMDAAYSFPDGSINDDRTPKEGPYIDPSGQRTDRYKGGPGNGSIGWNPVQGGDEAYKGTGNPNPNASPVLTHYTDGSKAYYKTQPLQWDLDNIKGNMYMEGWINFDPANGNAFRWHRRWTMFRNDQHIGEFQTSRQQEAPCMYTTPHYRRYLYCTGQPYTNASLTEQNIVANPNLQQQPVWSTEPFVFSVNPDDGKTIVLLAHNARFTFGRFVNAQYAGGEPGWENPSGFDAGYLNSAPQMHLDVDGTYDLDAAIGYFNSLDQARAWAYSQPRWDGLPEYRFDQVTKTRMGFWLHHAQDQLEKNMNGSMDVRPLLLARADNGKDMKFTLPEKWINGRVVKHLYLKANVTSSTNQFWVNWRKAGDNTDYHKVFTMPNDSQDHVTDIDMSGEANWSDKDVVQVSISHVYSGSWPDVTNDVWRVKYISYRNLN